MDFKVIFLVVILFCGFSNCHFHEQLSKIKPKTSEEVQASAAFDVIKRLVGNLSDLVQIHVDFRLPQNYFKVRKLEIQIV